MYCLTDQLKVTVHPKKCILSSFTLPLEISDLYNFLAFAGHKGRYFDKCWYKKTVGPY